MKDLMKIRQEIDAIDREMVSLYQKRMGLAEDVAAYKIANHKNVYDKEREQQKLEQLSQLAEDNFLRQGVIELFEQIMSTSRKKQYKILAEQGLMDKLQFTCCDSFDYSGKKIVFQGVEGAYAQMAMYEFFGEDCMGSAVATWRDAMEAIQSGEADYAVLPIENSSAGIVGENYDLLNEYDVCIVGEQVIKIEHALLGLPGATISDIQTVYSHPQALMQCSHFLEVEHPDWESKAKKNTAVSAQKIKGDNDITKAAIASIQNAKIYNLQVLQEAIQDEADNETRFIIVSREKKYLKTADKVSLCFELPHEKGSLYHILSHFIFNGVNMTKIESRPKKGVNWEYQFFIDVQGNLANDDVLSALRGIKEETSSFKVIGNYKAFD
ncbi:MAG: prephenate dehydratase [Lachnospiraceae bacterium]|nr:prephenate dehydratase [Lachnospiraceae bacterium]